MKINVAVSGGDLELTDKINKYAISLVKKDNPKVIFIPTAMSDSEKYIKNITDYYTGLGCTVESLCLFRKNYSQKDMKEMLLSADLIYVGGGNPPHMLGKWKETGVDKILIRAREKGIVMTGESAGSMYWFTYGHSDFKKKENPDKWEYSFVECFDIFHMAFCPHYNEEGRESFDDMLKDINVPGLALDNGTAFVAIDDEYKIIKSKEDARAFLISYEGGEKIKRELKDGEIIERLIV